ncbi:1-deoxy-D-xylulose-5-phosphate reductoisomerase [Peptococcaceae bacterium DYL19]|nr:1-deoxy-D-xylulose-5-phosphate reductoisomerase [Phosphitispora fastidiosa]MBU7008308.1 1-deoxy-D-xylulose-5-phosphate reductoisomerase [Phosphitispora fastidiosa]
MKNIVVLGSTGSIGTQTLEVLDRFPDSFQVIGLAAGSSLQKLAAQVNKYRPKIVSVGTDDDIPRFRSLIPSDIEIVSGVQGMSEIARMAGTDVVVTSITGTLGLLPTIEAINAGKDIALANKETLVAAGEIVMKLAQQKGVSILPVDSEHSAIFQCLNGEERSRVSRIILTASGGPFRDWSPSRLRSVTVADALKHPNWSMGRKITVDSATMMNKGLEVIEARWLFDVELQDIDVLIHPQSIVHSMVEFTDGSVLAQMGLPDMKLPIQYALTYPERPESGFPKLDLAAVGQLSFTAPRPEIFSCLGLAYEAGRQGGTMPAVLNAANEKAVEMFLNGQIGFLDIPLLIENVMANHTPVQSPGLDDILRSDIWAREEAQSAAGKMMLKTK